jgi:protein glucosyltransferase
MGSLVFKQKASLFEFWEPDLVPFEHYVPVNEDLSNLVEMVEWALNHDDQAQRIAMNGVRFVKEKLGEERIMCYWAELLTRYGSLMDYRPEVDSNVAAFLPFY